MARFSPLFTLPSTPCLQCHHLLLHDPDVSLTPLQRCVCLFVWVHVHGCVAGTHGLIFYPDACLSAAHSWHSTAGHSLYVCVCVCVCVGTSPPHTCTETDMVPTLSINLRCIYYNSAAHMDDGCGIIRNLDHKPTPLSPVSHSDSMWHCRLLNNIIAPELCLANYNSWLRGMEGTRIEGRLWGFACVQFLADLSDQCESDREGGRYKI